MLVEACSEVANPILFSTLIIVMTFLPIFSFEHVEGRLFRPLAVMMNFNLIGAVLATTCVIPILCYIAFFRFPPSERESPIALWIEQLYEPLLKGLMSLRHLVIFAACCLFGLAIVLLPLAGSEFIPELEEGNIWLTVSILPTGVTLDRAVADSAKLRKILGSYPEVKTVVSEIGSPDDGTDPNGYNNLQILVDLNPQTDWRKQFATKDDLVDDMRKNLNAELPGLLFNFSQYIKDNMDEAIAGAKGEFAAKIYGQDITVLEDLGRQVSHSLAKIEGMTDIAHDHLSGQPQLIVRIDRQRAARYGINANDILDVIETSVGGRVITQLFEGERRFDIILRFGKSFREDASEVSNILIATTSGARVPLSQVATISESHGASTILRDDNERRMAVHANIHGRDLGSAATEAMQRIRKEVQIPPGFRIEFAGQYERAKQAGATLAITIPTTLLLIFLLLNTVFDSSALAAIAMATVPLAAAFGIFSLLLTGNHLSISSGVGFIALFGVCIQNGVVLTAKMREFSNSGLTPMEAAVQGAIIRIRPVIIGSLVALVGLVPAALSNGIGSQSQKPFAIVIVGGILPATLLTLVVLPILYSWFGGKQRHHHSFHLPWSGSHPAEAEKLVEEFQHE